MWIEQLNFQHLRNHAHTVIDCPEGILLLRGENGAGKTTILEAISLLCMTRSFVSTQDRSLIQENETGFSVSGVFSNLGGGSNTIRIDYPSSRQRKTILLNDIPVESASDVIGKFPLVTLSPQHHPILTGGPAERRAFIDIVISQARHSYLLDLIEYRKIIKHRNAILSNEESSPANIRSLLEPWDISFAQLAVRIIKRRKQFLDEFTPFFIHAYEAIAGVGEQSQLRYKSTLDVQSENVDEKLSVDDVIGKMNNVFGQEYRRGTTLLGPHRDDMEIILDGRDVRTQASQGQLKTLLVALKIAEYYYLENQLDEKPIILLDDVFSELDTGRLQSVIQLIEGLGQTFITSVSETAVSVFPHWNESHAILKVESGRVMQYAM